MRSLTRSSSALAVTSGTMISGMTLVPSRAACFERRLEDRARLHLGDFGVAHERREPRWPSIGLNSRKPETRRFSLVALTPMAVATSSMALRHAAGIRATADRAGEWSPAGRP